MVSFNRERELAELDDLLRQDGPQFLVVYGRRRIGKTTLLTHWIDRHGAKTSAYWVAHRTTSDVLLRGFSDTIARLLPARPQGIVFANWNAALQQIFVLARQQRLVVVFDEFPYLVESVPEIPTLLQKLWDQESRETQVVLVLCGSHYHMMHHQFLSPRQPLYGRATAVVRVEEMGHGDLGPFLSRYGTKQLVETYSVIGGVPKYLELWDDHVSVLQNVERLILSPASLFRHEALMLIQDEISEPRTYLAILECLGAGLKTPADLARDSGIAINHMGKYLHTLVELRLVRRVLSEDAPDRNRTRVSRYEIRDPFLRFYFEFLYRHPELIEQNRGHQPPRASGACGRMQMAGSQNGAWRPDQPSPTGGSPEAAPRLQEALRPLLPLRFHQAAGATGDSGRRAPVQRPRLPTDRVTEPGSTSPHYGRSRLLSSSSNWRSTS